MSLQGEGYRICLVDVGLYHFPEDGLATDVPDLKGHLDVPGQLHTLHEEVHPDRLLVGLAEVVITEAHDQGGLADRAIAQDNHLVLEVLRSIVLIIIVVVLLALWFHFYN